MISEIANSLFLTYLASEYLVSSPLPPSSSSSSTRSRTIQRADRDSGCIGPKNPLDKDNYIVLGFLTFLVGIANLLDHHYYLSLFWGYATTIVPKNLPRLVPRIIPSDYLASYYLVIPAKLSLAATSYVLALYVDIHRDRTNGNGKENSRSNNNNKNIKTKMKMPFRSVFLPKVGWAFAKILPAYPFLAVLISFVFLFVVDLWEYVFHLPLEWLNNPIYYGTLYGPFAYTYVHVKREVLRRNHYDYTKGYDRYDNSNTDSTRTDAFV
jgi:hypothetical protein